MKNRVWSLHVTMSKTGFVNGNSEFTPIDFVVETHLNLYLVYVVYSVKVSQSLRD